MTTSLNHETCMLYETCILYFRARIVSCADTAEDWYTVTQRTRKMLRRSVFFFQPLAVIGLHDNANVGVELMSALGIKLHRLIILRNARSECRRHPGNTAALAIDHLEDWGNRTRPSLPRIP